MPDPAPAPDAISVGATVPAVLPEPAPPPTAGERLTSETAPRKRRWRSLLWLVALAAVLSLQLWFPNLDSEVHDSYSAEVAGRRAFYELVATPDLGLPPVRRNFEPLKRAVERLPTGSLLCILGPSRVPTPQEWLAILNWVQQGGAVLVATRWEKPELEVPALQAKVVSNPLLLLKPTSSAEGGKNSASEHKKKAAALQKWLAPSGPFRSALLPQGNAIWKSNGEIEAPSGATIVWEGERPQAARWTYGQGTVVLVASDYIFSNDSLAEPERDNAGLAIQLLKSALQRFDSPDLETPGTEIVFDEFLNTTGTPKVIGVMLNDALRPITLQIMALLVLFGMTGSRRFGGLLPRATPERRDITEHINSLGVLYYRANNSRQLLTLMLERVRQDLRLRGDKDPDPATWAAAAQRVRREPAALRQLLLDAKEASQDPKLRRRKGAALLRQLAELRYAARQR